MMVAEINPQNKRTSEQAYGRSVPGEIIPRAHIPFRALFDGMDLSAQLPSTSTRHSRENYAKQGPFNI